MRKPLSAIKTGRLRRRLSLSLASFRGGSRYAAGSLGNVFKSGEKRREANSALLAREAQAFVAELGDLKGAYVKIGQILGIYGQYILPPAVTEALLSLNDRTSPLAWSAIEPCLKRDLGEDFADFQIDRDAVAAASIGQIHRAVHLPSEHTVCLKVQYPGVAQTVANDFRDIISFLELARWLRRDRESKGLVEEVQELLALEIDYEREAAMCRRVGALLQDDERYRVPEVYDDFCGPELIVMDFIDGHYYNSPQVQGLSQDARNALAESVLELFFKEIFQWRLVQTDANAGNYLVDLEGAQPRLALLDFGAVREFDRQLADALCLTIAGAVERDLQQTITGLNTIGCFAPDQSEAGKQRFAEFCFLLVEPFRAAEPETPAYAVTPDGAYRWGKANLVRRVAKLAGKSALAKDFRVPRREFALITRKLSGVFSALSALDAELDASELLQGYIRDWRQRNDIP